MSSGDDNGDESRWEHWIGRLEKCDLDDRVPASKVEWDNILGCRYQRDLMTYFTTKSNTTWASTNKPDGGKYSVAISDLLGQSTGWDKTGESNPYGIWMNVVSTMRCQCLMYPITGLADVDLPTQNLGPSHEYQWSSHNPFRNSNISPVMTMSSLCLGVRRVK